MSSARGVVVVGLMALLVSSCGSGSGDSQSPGNGGGAGAGGSVGGSGGSGGTGAIGSGGLGGSGVYGNVCAAVEALSCFPGDCETTAQGNLDQATARGCVPQLVAAFQCYEQHPPTCDAQEGFKPDAECDAPVAAYNACLQGSGACTMAGFLAGCVVVCDIVWGAECSVDPGNSYWDCFCRVGPNVGTSFTLPTVDKCDEALSAAQCAP